MAEASHPQNLMIYYIPWIILIVTIVIQIFHYSFFGPKIKNKEGTERLLWWSIKERIIHLILMLTFLIIVITGLILTVSPEKAQSGIMSFIRNLHNIGPIYGIASLLMLIIWIRCALFKKYDFTWLRHIGGYLGYKGELKSGKFNAGQKLWFWMVIIFGAALVISGARIGILETGPGRDVAVLIHLISASIMLAMLLVHMYMSIFVVKGTWSSIFTGKINKQTAQKLHSEAPEFKKR
jgi:formate dehydrogenase subunit gamma